MHPIERLRAVARAGREDATALAREAASALASFSAEPAALVTACRRLVERQPTCGPMWWLAARVLTAPDPTREAWHAADELGADPTPAALASELPADAAVVVLGWPDQVGSALARRGDVRALVVDALDEGAAFVRWLRRGGSDAELVAESGLAAAVRASDLVLLEAVALGPGGCAAVSGSAPAPPVGRQCGVPVWAVAGVGRVLPGVLWEAVAARLAARGRAWEGDEEIVDLRWIDEVVGPDGRQPAADAPGRPTCPPVRELAATARR